MRMYVWMVILIKDKKIYKIVVKYKQSRDPRSCDLRRILKMADRTLLSAADDSDDGFADRGVDNNGEVRIHVPVKKVKVKSHLEHVISLP